MYYKYKDTTHYIPFMFLSMIFSYYIYYRYSEGEKWLAILFVSLFLCTFMFLKREFLLTAIIFFIFGFLVNNMYYKGNISTINKIRITKITSYETIGTIQNRLVYLEGKLDGIQIGDKIVVKGEYNNSANINKGIIGSIEVNDYKILREDLTSKIYKIRPYIFNKMRVKLGNRRAALVSSMAFGYVDYLDLDDKTNMKNLGVLHAISVSGLHLALVYTLLKKVIGDKNALLLSLAYVFLTGAVSSTVRAYIMLFIISLAPIIKRNYNGISALSLAGIIILILRPYNVFSIGFWLSFTATLGIVLFNSKLNKKLYKLPKILRESLSVSLSSQVFSFPIMAGSFYEFSLNFILGNLILAPFITLIVAIGNIAILLSVIEPIFNYLCYLLFYITYALDNIIRMFESIQIPLLIMNEYTSILYISFAVALYFIYRGHKKMIIVPICAFLTICLSLYSNNIKIKYYKEGAFLVKYKWDRVLFVTNKKMDTERLYKITLANKIYNENTLKLKENIFLEIEGKNTFMKVNNNRYFLKTTRGNFYNKYDIIDFSNDKSIIINSDNMITID